jgi:uncharacterized protein (TIGR03083 family)
MSAIGDVYAAGRGRITELVSGLSSDAAATRVPTCPEWSVHDVIAHLAGVCADVLAGRIEGVATDPWTAAQVDARRGRPLAQVLAEWAEAAPQVEAMAEHFPGRVGSQWVLDVTTHEHDIRDALGVHGAQGSSGVDVGVEFMVAGLAASVAGHGLRPLEVRTSDGRSWMAGTGEPYEGSALDALNEALMGRSFLGGEGVETAGMVEVPSAFDLMRALTGRRSLEQVRGFTWKVDDPEPYVAACRFGPFTPSPTDVTE